MTKRLFFLLPALLLSFSLFTTSCSDDDGNDETKLLVSEITLETGTISYEYDKSNRLLKQNYTGNSGETVYASYIYDDNGMLIKRIYSSEEDLFFTHKDDSIFIKRHTEGPLVNIYVLNEKRQIKEIIVPTNNQGILVKIEFEYDSRGNNIKETRKMISDNNKEVMFNVYVREYDSNKGRFSQIKAEPWVLLRPFEYSYVNNIVKEDIYDVRIFNDKDTILNLSSTTTYSYQYNPDNYPITIKEKIISESGENSEKFSTITYTKAK
ncbi:MULTISPECIES: hypothetical protein [unclassified Dysgonomonas]|uniref:hypothetical protein n=1 Tax=unclassified Dysgonomonas TaxID=2630389 RepID=UPI0024730458|nr:MULTISPECIES: hypothetical protein [unclassified Dysgonomonas]